jgi:hypothetical protein
MMEEMRKQVKAETEAALAAASGKDRDNKGKN